LSFSSSQKALLDFHSEPFLRDCKAGIAAKQNLMHQKVLSQQNDTASLEQGNDPSSANI
jgi:hypothetical protein